MKQNPLLKYLILSVIFFFQVFILNGQITKKKSLIQLNSNESVAIIKVKDSKTKEPMIGATIFLSCKNDTLKTITNNNGLAYFNDIPFKVNKDTINLNLSFIGYNDIVHKYKHEQYVRFEALMEENPEQLSEIIIKADAVTMVVRGDTTIFKTHSIQNMEGANLASLLRKIPGITSNNGRLLANGKPVSKILINGSAIFNNNLSAAMELIKSDEVKEVKIYDQYDQNRLLKLDTLKSKERVVDVMTKKKISIRRKTELLAAIGIFKEKNNKNNLETLGGVDLKHRRYGIQIPSYNFKASFLRNYSDNRPSAAPVKDANIKIRTSFNKKYKRHYTHSLNLKWNKSENENESNAIYKKVEGFKHKEIERSQLSKQKDLAIKYFGEFGWSIGEYNSITTEFGLKYSRDKNFSLNKVNNILDDKFFHSDISNGRKSDTYNGNFAIKFQHLFKKKGRKLDLDLYANFRNRDGQNHRIDTAAKSYASLWILDSLKIDSKSLTFSSAYNEPITDNLSLALKYKVNSDFSNEEKFSFDQLLNLQDSINTFDFQNRKLSNLLFSGLDFKNKRNNLRIKTYLQYDISSQKRKEYFPEKNNYPNNYKHLSPYINLNYYSTKITITAGYSEKQLIPSITDTWERLDNSSPMFLRAGNPNLKQTILRDGYFSMNFNFPKSTQSISSNFNYSDTKNAIAYNKIYFTEDTPLNNYNYTAKAGSQLIMPKNVKGVKHFLSSLSFSSFFYKTYFNHKINGMLSISAQNNWVKQPFLINNTLHNRKRNSYGLGLSGNLNFSKYVEFFFDSSTSYEINFLDGKSTFKALSESLSANIKINLMKHLWLKSFFWETWMKPNKKEIPSFHKEVWNIDVSWKFGKPRNIELGISCKDILNKNKNRETMSIQDYILTNYTSIFGSSFSIFLKYDF